MRISCRVCRRLGTSICGREKCAFKRKPYPPGEHGRASKYPRASSEFGIQLREKQKLKFMYNLREAQFRNYVREAERRSGDSAENLVQILESRLDNVVYRLGLANSRTQARQAVSHGHFKVNGRRVTIPSYRVRKGDKIAIREGSTGRGVFKDIEINLKKFTPPAWLSLDKDKKEGEILGLASMMADPSLAQNVNLKAIIEFYSR
jgi:small subunit ribosomal protein S4